MDNGENVTLWCDGINSTIGDKQPSSGSDGEAEDSVKKPKKKENNWRRRMSEWKKYM